MSKLSIPPTASPSLPPPARYSLGQNFLINPSVINSIADAADINNDTLVIELGVGRGALTAELCRRAAEVIGVEKDANLIKWALDNSIYPSNLKLINEDMLHTDFEKISMEHNRKLNIIGNLPYNISSQIVIKLIDIRHCIESATLMFQKEVAQRLAAKPGGKNYGILSVQAGYSFIIKKKFDISPNQFRPRPKIISTVITFKPKVPEILVKDFDLFRNIVRAAFQNRRKMMLNSLKKNTLFDEEAIKQCMEEASIPLNARAEDVGINSYAIFSNCVGLKTTFKN